MSLLLTVAVLAAGTGHLLPHLAAPPQPQSNRDEKAEQRKAADNRAADGEALKGAARTALAWKTPGTNWFWLPLEILLREKIGISASHREGLLTIPAVGRGTS